MRKGRPSFHFKKPDSLVPLVSLAVLCLCLVVLVSLRVADRASGRSAGNSPFGAPSVTPSPAPISVGKLGGKKTEIPADEPEQEAEPTSVPNPEFYVISLIGDCTLAENKDKRGWGTAYQSVVGDDYAYPFSNTVQYFRDDYMTLANLECTLTDNWYDTIEWFGFLAPSAYANILTEGCVDFVTLANNHVMDYGAAAYGDTLRALNNVGMPFAGENEIYLYQRGNGLKVGVFCLYNEKQPTKELLDAGLKKLRAAGADFTIAALHWGDEGAYTVNDIQIEMGHYAIDAGFNVVYGSHSHRLQPVEQYGDGLIFYSMANWTFGGHTNPDDYDTAIAQFTVKKVGDEVSIAGLNLIPCSISSRSHNHEGHSVNDNCLNDYCPTPYEEGSEDWNRVLTKLDGTYEGANYQTNYQSIVYGTS